MSYPRNSASPPIYDVGSLVQISDGALQTSGASARVKIGSGAWGAAAGSLDCDATSGIWTYVPSQAETDAESFILAVYKTGCVSISRTIVPSANSTAGLAQVGGYASGQAPLQPLVAGRQIAVSATTGKVTAEAVELDADAQAMVAAFNAMRSGNVFTEAALANAPSGGTGLTGPFSRTITVTDAADDSPIEAAKVRLYRTGETETKPTDSDGEASFTTEAATFSYAVTANGYGGASGTIVISANGSTTIELTATAVTPPTDPSLSAIEVLCLNANFAATAGIDIDFRMSAIASGDQNRAHPGAKKTVTSNGSGIARFEGPQGATIEWKRGTGQQWTAVTLDNDAVTNVTSLIGSP